MRMMWTVIALAAAFALTTDLEAAAADKGKDIYQKTCRQCHGPNGNGDRAADRFFQTTIPRLSSAYVQDKTDEELKEIITKGRRKMEPVRMGQPAALHNLAAEQVEDVIAYVRTLKKK